MIHFYANDVRNVNGDGSGLWLGWVCVFFWLDVLFALTLSACGMFKSVIPFPPGVMNRIFPPGVWDSSESSSIPSLSLALQWDSWLNRYFEGLNNDPERLA